MVDEGICAVCGNFVEPMLSVCPYCNKKREPVHPGALRDQYRVVNLERGMPLVKDALQRLTIELEAARHHGCGVLVLIHGYGSSGKGGAIKDEVRKQLHFLLESKRIKGLLPGEECGKRSGRARMLLKQFPLLKEHLAHSNPGISLVVL